MQNREFGQLRVTKTTLFLRIYLDIGPKAELANVLNSLSWEKRVIEKDLVENKSKIVYQKDVLEGLTGRIPVRLFESLKNTKVLKNVFDSTNFGVFQSLIGTDGNNLTRGLAYPVDLFKFNLELEEIPNMFANIPTGVDINADLFSNNSKLTNRGDLLGFAREYIGDIKIKSQINFRKLFANSPRIVNASYLFAVFDLDLKTKDRFFFIICLY